MIGFLTRLVGGALDPLIDRASAVGGRLLRKLALFLVAAVCLVVVLIALTIAFDLWVASMLGAIAGALAVAGVYLLVAIAAIVLALRGGSAPKAAASDAPGSDAARAQESARRDSARKEQVDAFAAPLMSLLASLGLRREQLAVLAGSSLAKQLGPLPLVGLAIVGGFLVGRMWKSWRAILSSDALTGVLAALGLSGLDQGRDQQGADGQGADDEDETAA